MKHIKKVFAFALTLVMAFALALPAFAEGDPSITINSTADSGETGSETTVYTYWKILDADIDTDVTVSSETGDNSTPTTGVVAYFVTTEAAKTAIENTGLFNVTRVGTTNKWYVELKDKGTTADDIITKLSELGDEGLTTAFGEPKTMTSDGESASSGTVDAGYYYIKSSLGNKIAVQTLSPVTINEKNDYPTTTKTVAKEVENAQIGDEITYTLEVVVPTTANDAVVLTDTMDAALTFKSIDSVKAGDDGVTYTTTPETLNAENVTSNGNSFVITFSAETIKTCQGKTITITYTAVLNNKAVVGTPVKNSEKIKYGNNYESVAKEVSTNTYSFDFDKVDGNSTETKLTGAEFQLTLDGSTPINLIEVEAGKTYRVAMSEDTATPITTITSIGETITINGLDSDVTYKLVETKSPTSYNKLDDPIEVKANNSVFAHQDIRNYKGTELPSTGGIGTTIFYIVGGIMVVGAVVMLLAKRRAASTEE